MPYTPILGTLCYVVEGDRVLMIHRQGRPDDLHLGKYNGLGGKVEPGEDVVTCMRREIREESGLDCEQLTLKGTISWPGFGKSGEDWFGFLFRVDRFRGEPFRENADGTLEWLPVERVLELPLWEGDRFFLPLIFEATERQFHGVMPYRDGRPVSWSYSQL
jgi:8-oxo-dGTP diphosphatase